MPWSTHFPEPIHGLASLRDAANYIRKLPKAEQEKPYWQIAVAHLIKAAEGEPAWMIFAGMAMLQALNHGRVQEKEPRRKRAKTYRIVRSP